MCAVPPAPRLTSGNSFRCVTTAQHGVIPQHWRAQGPVTKDRGRPLRAPGNARRLRSQGGPPTTRNRGGVMSEQDPEQPAEEFHRDRREHGGIPGHLDDDQLARLTEEERVEAGLDDYDPDEVPPATDEPPEPDIARSDIYQEARAEIRREYDKDELLAEGQRDPYPPTRYDE